MPSLRSLWILGCMTLALSACGTEEGRYVYPPTYLSVSEVPPTLLPPPTDRDSAAYEAEIKTIRKLQTNITAEQKKRLWDEAEVRPEMLTMPVFGPRFNRERLPKTFALLDRIGSDNKRITDAAKEYWNTERPFEEDTRVKLLGKKILIPAYPSGHTSATALWAETLSLILPRYATMLREEAAETALNRLRAGVHYPHDIEGGRLLAKEELKLLRTKPTFRAALKDVAAELRFRGWIRAQGAPQAEAESDPDPLDSMPLPDRQSIMLQPL